MEKPLRAAEAGDLRQVGDGKQRAFLKILAGVAQLDFDLLYRRDLKRRRRRSITWSLGGAALAAVAVAAGVHMISLRNLADSADDDTRTSLVQSETMRGLEAQFG